MKKVRILPAGRYRDTGRTTYAENTALALNSDLLIYVSKACGRVGVAKDEKGNWN